MNKPPVSIEVANDKGHAVIKTGQMLTVCHESPCFLWVRAFDGVRYKVSRKTKRIIGTDGTFIGNANRQPLMNF